MPAQTGSSDLFKNYPAEQLCELLRLDKPPLELLALLQPADWPAIIRNAARLGLAPVCYARLEALNLLNRIPPVSAAELKNFYLIASARGIRRHHELEHVLQALKDARAPVMLLKGAHLAEEVYQDLALRPMSDLDLLVHKDDLMRAADTLVALGYRTQRAYWIEFETSVSHQLPNFHHPNHCPIEIHWTLILPEFPYPIDLDGVWGRSQPLQIGAAQGYGLAVEDLLLHLSIHSAVQHRITAGLRFVYDIGLVLAHFKDQVDWPILADRARRWKAERPLYLMTRLSRELFGAAVPDGFLESIKPGGYDPSWSEAARDLLFFDRGENPAFSTNLAIFLSSHSLAEKIRLFFRQIFLPPEEMAEIYPVLPDSPRLLLYYPVRLKFLLGRHIHSILRAVKRDPEVMDSARLAEILREREDFLMHRLTS
jgi:hypothetical protein